MEAEEIDDIECDMLGLCGCGNPEEVREYIRERLERVANKQYPDYEEIAEMFFLYVADNRGWLEHGGTIRCSWLTDKGKDVLKTLNRVREE